VKNDKTWLEQEMFAQFTIYNKLTVQQVFSKIKFTDIP
jgi:hypothetical protein